MTSSVANIKLKLCALALCVLVCLPAGATGEKKSSTAQEQDQVSGQDTPAREKDDPRARAEYLEKRRSGGQPVPPGARLRAMREQERMMQNEAKRFWESTSAAAAATTESTSTAPQTTAAAPEQSVTPAPSPQASQWVFIGPQPTNPNPSNAGAGNHFSGRVTAIAVDPSDSTGNTVYLGAAQGGVWKTTTGGTSWTALTDSQDSLAIGSVAIDPQNSQILYAGTGEENFGSDNYYGIGILRSIDGGAHWTNVAPTNAFLVITEPEAGCTATRPGNACGGLRIGSLAASIQSSATVVLAAVQGGFSNTGGLYWSNDIGAVPNGTPATFHLATGIPDPTGNGLRFTADSVVFGSPATAPLIAYAGIHSQGVYKSVDGGKSFTAINNGITVAGTQRVFLSAAPSDPSGNTVYAALENASGSTLAGLYRTTDGTNWTKLTSTPDFCGGSGTGQCFYDMLVSVSPTNKDLVFIGGSGYPNTGFLFHTTGGTLSATPTWVQDTTNIHADQHAGAFAPDGSFYIGNDGGVYKTSGISSNPVTWTELNSTLGITQFYGYFAIDPNNSSRTYGGTQDNGTQLFSGNMPWDEVTCGDGAGAVIDSGSGRVFANCNDVDVRESDTGAAGSFNHIDSILVNSGDRSGFIPPLVGDHSNPQRIYFGTTRVWQAQSATSPAWAFISGQVTGSTSKTVTNMDVSNDGTTMYTVSEDGKVFKGTSLLSGTASFIDVTSTGFPAGNYITAVRISPTDNNTAYITLSGFGAGQHIFKSTGGGTWANITGNLPNTPVNDLVVDPDLPGTLYAATDIGVFSATENGTSTNWTTLTTMLPKIAVLGLRLHRGTRTLRAATHGRGMWDLYVPACNPNAGPCLTLSPTSVNFDDQPVGTSSSQHTVTVTNTGNQNLTINGITVAGSDYSYTTNCGTVASNGTCNVNFTFSPRDGLARNGSVTIYSNGGNATVALTGNGLVVPANDSVNTPITITSLPFTASVITNGATSSGDPTPPCVTLFPADSLGYDTSVNHHSIWFSYTPQVPGTIDLDTQLTSGIDTVLSVWTGTPGSLVAANGPDNTPACNDDSTNSNNQSVKQSKIAGMTVNANTTYWILVSGYYANDFGNIVFHMQQSSTSVATGSPFTLSASSLSFTALLNRPSAAQTVTITNASGSPQTVSSVTVSSGYSVLNNCGGLSAGASCTATVTLNPGVVGQRNGVLTISDGAAGNPQTVPLSGFTFNFSLNNPRPHRSNRSGGVVQGQREVFDVALQTSTGGATLPVSLSCENVPLGAVCTVSPAQVNATDGSTQLIVTFDGSRIIESSRARRLASKETRRSYNLKVTARVGGAEATILIPVTVDGALPRSVRLSH